MTLHLVSYDDAGRTRGPLRTECGRLVSSRELAKAVEDVTCEKCKERSDAHDRAEV